MNERFKLLRKVLNLTQSEIGLKLGVTKSNVSRIENGSTNITDRVVSDICREFEVNEEWLRDGIGEMFKEEDDFSLDEYLNQNACSIKEIALIKSFAKAYLQFPKELRDNFIDNVINDFKHNMSSIDFIHSMHSMTTIYDESTSDIKLIAESKEE